MAQSIFSGIKYPWSNPFASKLHETLVVAYSNGTAIRLLADKAGVDTLRINWNSGVYHIWQEVLDAAALAGRLEGLLQQVLKDPGVGGIHALVNEAFATTAPETTQSPAKPSASPATQGVAVYALAADQDQEQVTYLGKHLYMAIRKGKLRLWNPWKVAPGLDGPTENQRQLATAQVILLFISPDLISEEYQAQLDQARKRADDRKARVIPILLRATAAFRDSDFAGSVALPRNGNPVNAWRDKDEVWSAIASEITTVASIIAAP